MHLRDASSPTMTTLWPSSDSRSRSASRPTAAPGVCTSLVLAGRSRSSTCSRSSAERHRQGSPGPPRALQPHINLGRTPDRGIDHSSRGQDFKLLRVAPRFVCRALCGHRRPERRQFGGGGRLGSARASSATVRMVRRQDGQPRVGPRQPRRNSVATRVPWDKIATPVVVSSVLHTRRTSRRRWLPITVCGQIAPERQSHASLLQWRTAWEIPVMVSLRFDPGRLGTGRR